MPDSAAPPHKRVSLAERHGHTTQANLLNALLMVAVAVPVVFFVRASFVADTSLAPASDSLLEWALSTARQWHPLLAVNVYFFVFVCIGFWLLSLAQDSTWLIDPYWTFIPVLIAHFYASHPDATDASGMRSYVTLLLTWFWSVRLTHNYFRREEWNFGAREDWRFTEYRQKFGRWWWIVQLPVAYLSQQLMLVGITVPLYAVNFATGGGPAWSMIDVVATVACVAGVVTAYFADTQLHDFIRANEAREAAGHSKVLVLDTGLWRYSRHPNHFGEQLFWWGLSLFAVHLDALPWYWCIAGTLFNTACLIVVMRMVEDRMLARPERRAAFEAYIRRTPFCIPALPL